jgi:deoxyguanosine kinase
MHEMLIAIEGCVGAGKTTVAKGLARHRGSQLLLEDFETNPFLRSFYANPSDNALETEFSFLLLHFHQLKNAQRSTSATELLSDFHLWKDPIYADLNLADRRIVLLFRDLYSALVERTLLPSLMVFLSASTDLVLDRIERRRREFELGVDPEYFARVNSAYEVAIAQYPSRKVCLSMDQWDFVRNPDLFEELSVLVDRELEC